MESRATRRTATRRGRPGWLLLAWLGSAFAADPSWAQATEPAEDAQRGRDTGVFLSFGALGERASLDFDARVSEPEANLDSGAWGHGGCFGVGYGFGPGLRVEMSLSLAGHDARPTGTEALLFAAHFDGYVPIRTRGRLRPHLLGGFGLSIPEFTIADAPDRAYLMVSGDIGAGLRLLLSRHWSVQGDYFHSVLDIDQETFEESSDLDMRSVGGTGQADVLRVQFSYDF